MQVSSSLYYSQYDIYGSSGRPIKESHNSSNYSSRLLSRKCELMKLSVPFFSSMYA